MVSAHMWVQVKCDTQPVLVIFPARATEIAAKQKIAPKKSLQKLKKQNENW